MSHNDLVHLCNKFEIGPPLSPPKRVFGGLLHTMWRLDTAKGSYAIKQLSEDIQLTDERIVKNYDFTEKIASRFLERGVPAVCAMQQKEKSLILRGNTGFLIYPWVDADPLHKDAVSEPHALKIAAIIARLHRINLEVPEISEPVFDIHSNKKLARLFHKAQRFHCPFSTLLEENQNAIFEMNTDYQNTLPLLKTEFVISHGDLDQKMSYWIKTAIQF